MTADASETERLREENARLRGALDMSWKAVLAYPFPQVCKHLVASNMLEAMAALGMGVPAWVTKAIVEANDPAALSYDRAVHGTVPPAPAAPLNPPSGVVGS